MNFNVRCYAPTEVFEVLEEVRCYNPKTGRRDAPGYRLRQVATADGQSSLVVGRVITVPVHQVVSVA